MKKILTMLIAFGLIVAPVNSFSVEPEAKSNESLPILIGLLASAILIATLVLSPNDDTPVSP